jgi:DNA mismatch repair ATPase MutS
MAFLMDQQTLDDLGIFGRRGEDSVYGLFNRTMTRQGATLLREMFGYPMADIEGIRKRSAIFQYFFRAGLIFPFKSELFDIAEAYLSDTDERTRLSGEMKTLGNRVAGLIAEDNEYKNVYKAVNALLAVLQTLRVFLDGLAKISGPYDEERAAILGLFDEQELQVFLAEDLKAKLPFAKVAGYDSSLRFRHRGLVQKLLQHIYRLDVYISVGKVASERGFSFPVALAPGQHGISLQGVYHPLVKNAVANTLDITATRHILFLTGANMAGKSTFMKTMGIALFLAHMGFPVPARQMEFSMMDGIYTSINLSDNLGLGASHFYAEVLRIKKVATALAQGHRLFVIFDELFRGTNVRDAYEATVALASAFAEQSGSIFLVSTHIIEAGEVLRQDGRVRLVYLPTRMEGNEPVYSYVLEEGITSDRHGMVIINNEGILDLLAGVRVGDGGDAPFADRQTLDDLNLTGKYRPGSIYSMFNRVKTAGGERLLDEVFGKPLTDAGKINERVARFRYLQDKAVAFPFTRDQIGKVEDYLHGGAGANRMSTTANVLRWKLQGAIVKDERYAVIVEGIRTMVDFIDGCRRFFGQFAEDARPWEAELGEARSILKDGRLRVLPVNLSRDHFGWQDVVKYHHLFGSSIREQIGRLCVVLYGFDLAISVGEVARERNFTWPLARMREDNVYHVSDLRHPGVAKAIGNDLSFDSNRNLLFLTGANMAGKSTLMKAFGISLYLAHMGFPVAAKEMEFSVKEGMYSSINVQDDLSLGYSHFYAEVLRVKKVAEAVSRGRNLVVIFDELFKGTNVKDAYDATLSVTTALAAYGKCWLIISTHIIEVADSLAKCNKNIQFSFMPTVMNGKTPAYTYKLAEGVSADRQGMVIIENEGILAMLRD